MEPKGIDYVLSNSMKNGVTSISDVRPLQDNVIVLNNRSANPRLVDIKQKHKASRRSRKHKWMSLSTRRFRRENERVPRSALTHAKLAPLSALWDAYSSRVGTSERAVAAMDLHGARVTVTASADPSLVGVTGTVARESFGALLIVSPDDRVRQVNKNHTVVALETAHGRFELNLSALRCQPHLKATKRWKQRAPLPMPY